MQNHWRPILRLQEFTLWVKKQKSCSWTIEYCLATRDNRILHPQVWGNIKTPWWIEVRPGKPIVWFYYMRFWSVVSKKQIGCFLESRCEKCSRICKWTNFMERWKWLFILLSNSLNWFPKIYYFVQIILQQKLF